MRAFTDEEKEEILRLYQQEELSCEKIARIFHCRYQAVSTFLKDSGIVLVKGCSKNRNMNHFYFSKIDSPEKSYFLGLLFADGSVSLDNLRSPSIKLELLESDIEIIQKFLSEINSKAKITVSKREGREATCYFSIRSKQISDDLSKFNIIPNKTYATENVIVPEHFEEDFLRGFIDGDGSIYYSNNAWHVSICGHSENVIKDFVILGDKILGENSKNKITVTSEGVFHFCWNGKKALKLLEKLYYQDCIAIPRKASKAALALT